MAPGEQCVMTSGAVWMLELPAGSWDCPAQVSDYITAYIVKFIIIMILIHSCHFSNFGFH